MTTIIFQDDDFFRINDRFLLEENFPNDSRPPDIFRPATQALEAASPHPGYLRSPVHRGGGDFYFQCDVGAEAARSAAAGAEAQLQGAAGPAIGPDPGGKGEGKAGAAQDRLARASDIPFNTGEGLRAAYYRPDNAASYSSFKEHVHQIDILFPVWLHVSEPDGNLMAESNDDRREYPGCRQPRSARSRRRNKIKNVIAAAKEDTEVFPH
jgi:hypothetical protein